MGEPTRASLTILKRQLFANARAVPTNLGGGSLGHLFILMTPLEFEALPTAAPVIVPVHPGVQPPATGTASAIEQANREYDTLVHQFKKYHAVAEKLKALLLAAVDPLYLAILEDEIMGFATVSTATMLHHLFTTYGTIKPTDLDSNRERLTAIWMPEHSLESLWSRICDCQAFAIAGAEPIGDETAIRLVLTVLKHSWTQQDLIKIHW